MSRQKTITTAVTASGIGLHSARRVNLRILPAAANHGIVFQRIDLPEKPKIPAAAALVGDTRLCTALCKDGVRVATIEHLMSAFAGLGIDNALVQLDAAEVPIMDGSATTFVYLIQKAGIQDQDASKKYLKIEREVEVRDGDKWARLIPFNGMRWDLRIAFDHRVFRHRNNFYRIDFSTQKYISELSRARTFGFLHEIEWLHSNQLALGGCLDNAIVIDEFRVLNEHGLRYDDEFVRHKMLDTIGDLYLCGAAILGWYQGYKSGHDLNNKLARQLLATKKAWSLQNANDNCIVNIDYAHDGKTIAAY